MDAIDMALWSVVVVEVLALVVVLAYTAALRMTNEMDDEP